MDLQNAIKLQALIHLRNNSRVGLSIDSPFNSSDFQKHSDGFADRLNQKQEGVNNYFQFHQFSANSINLVRAFNLRCTYSMSQALICSFKSTIENENYAI